MPDWDHERLFDRPGHIGGGGGGPFAESFLERFPLGWNHLIEKESLGFNELEHVLIKKVEQLFRNML